MELRFFRQDLYGSYAEANEKGGLKDIHGLTTEYRRLFDVGGDLADTLSAIHTTSKMFNDKSTIRYVLFDDDDKFLDAC